MCWYLTNWWLGEILDAFLAIGSLLALAVILSIYNGRPLSEWTLPVQITTLVAFFATTGKVAILSTLTSCIGQLKWRHFAKAHRPLTHMQSFENATWDPYCALTLAWRLKGVSWLTRLGGILFFIAVLLEPFTQQSLSFPSLPTNRLGSDTASIPVAYTYDTGIKWSGGLKTGKYYSSLNLVNSLSFICLGLT